MDIDNHDDDISIVILVSQTEVQWLVAMTAFIAHPFKPRAVSNMFWPCGSHYQDLYEQNGYKTGGKHREICWM
jgi:hypothetical protein